MHTRRKQPCGFDVKWKQPPRGNPDPIFLDNGIKKIGQDFLRLYMRNVLSMGCEVSRGRVI